MKNILIIAAAILVAAGASSAYVMYYEAMDASLSDDGSELLILWNHIENRNGDSHVMRYVLNGNTWEKKGKVFDETNFAHSLNLIYKGGHEYYLVSDTWGRRILCVDRDMEVVWNSVNIGIGLLQPNDAELSNDGQKILVCDNAPRGVFDETGGVPHLLEVDIKTGEATLNIPFLAGQELHDADYLEDSTILLCVSSDDKVVVLNRDGSEEWSHQNPEWYWVRSAQYVDGAYYVCDGYSVYEVDSLGQETTLVGTGLKGAYNIHVNADGILVSDWLGVHFFDLGGNQIWFVREYIPYDTEDAPLPAEEWANMRSIGYIR